MTRAVDSLKWLAGLGIVAILFFNQRDAILSFGEGSRAWDYLVLALLILLATYLVTFMRWWLLVRAQRFVFRPWRRCA